MKSESFQFGDWQIDARACMIRHCTEPVEIQVEPRAMDVLSALCHQAGTILSAADLLHLCWDGLVVGENQVHKAITQLRRALRDSVTQPTYIENIRKRGYRTIAPVTFPPGHSLAGPAEDWARQSPYVGLTSFDAAHAAVFFGREAAVARLVTALSGRLAAGRPLLLVLGPSGSGKTSLIQAGLMPALRRGAVAVPIHDAVALDLGDVGGLPLATALGGALLDLYWDDAPLFTGLSAEEIGDRLTDEGGEPATCLPMPADAADGRFVLFIDRLEALFSTPGGGSLQRAQFLTALDRLARSGSFIVIAACRNDFYPDLAREPLLMEGKEAGGHFDLAPPTRTEIARMIRQPAQMAGLSFGVDAVSGEHLDDLLCDGVANNPDALPLLQYTLQQLYLQRSPARELTLAAYRALGGIDGAIGRRADAILEQLPAAAQATLPHIFSLIVAVGGSDGAARGLRAPWSALRDSDERRLVQTFVDERLFVSLVHGAEPVFGVAHEALLRQWPRAVAWISEHHQALRIRARLEGETQQWLTDGRRADRLLRKGRPLEEALDLLRARTVPLSADVSALINASSRQARRADRLRLGAVVGFALIALVAVAMGYQARRAESQAAQRREEAEGLVDFMLGDLTEKLQPLAKLDLLDGVAQKAMAYLTAEDPGRVPGPLRLRQAKALLTLADVNRSRGNVDAALTALGRAEKLLQANLAEGPVDGELLKSAGAVAFWFGQIALDRGQLDEAGKRFEQYRDFAKRMLDLAPQELGGKLELSYALSSLGSLKLRRDQVSEAAAEFQLSLDLKRQVMNQRPDDRSLAASIANSQSWLASARVQEGRLNDAVALYGEQRMILESLRQAQPEALAWSYQLALAYKLEASLLLVRGQVGAAIVSVTDGLAILEKLLSVEPDNRLWLREVAELRVVAARLYLSVNRLADANREISQGLELLERTLLPQAAQASDLRRVAVQAMVQQAEIRIKQNILVEAARILARAEPLARQVPQDKRGMALVANVMLARSAMERAQGNDETAIASCREVATSLADVAVRSSDYRILDPWVRANLCAGTQNAAARGISILEMAGYNDASYRNALGTQKETSNGNQ